MLLQLFRASAQELLERFCQFPADDDKEVAMHIRFEYYEYCIRFHVVIIF